MRRNARFAVCLLVLGACGKAAKPQSTPPPPDGGGAGAPEAGAGEVQPDRPTSAGFDAGSEQVEPDAPTSDAPAAPDAPASDAPAPMSDAPAAHDVAPESSAAPSLADALVRSWTAQGQGGNCIDISTWYTFGADGSVVNRDIDDNACTHVPRLLAKSSGSYTLAGRVLEMTLDGLGKDTGYLGANPPKETVTKRLERFPIATAVMPPPLMQAGRLALDRGAYTSDDSAHFRSERYALLGSATSDRIFEQRVQLAVTVDPPLPLAAGTPCKITVDFTLASFDAAATPATDNGVFHLEYMAIVRPSDAGWLRLLPQKVDGVAPDKTYAAWLEVLGGTDFGLRTLRFQNAFGVAFSYYLGHAPGDPKVLSGSLPTSGRWYESAKPPLVQ